MPKIEGLEDLKKDVEQLPLQQRVWFRLIIIIIGLVIAGGGYWFTQKDAPTEEVKDTPSINIQTGDVTQKQTQKNTQKQEVQDKEEE